jgi:hypothetical protein
MEYNIRGVPSQAVEKLWHFAEPFIKRALDHTFGEISAADVKGCCEQQIMQLWMIVEGNRVVGAAASQIVIYPQMRVCRIVAMAGTQFDDWKHMAHMNIELWALENECEAIECYVRKGFVPKLLDIGYKHRYSVVHKSLKKE